MGCPMPGHGNKREMAIQIAEELGIPQFTSKSVIQRFLDLTLDEIMAAGRVELRDFGVFTVGDRPAQLRRNPSTGERFVGPGFKVITFKAGRNVRARLNGKPEDEPRTT